MKMSRAGWLLPRPGVRLPVLGTGRPHRARDPRHRAWLQRSVSSYEPGEHLRNVPPLTFERHQLPLFSLEAFTVAKEYHLEPELQRKVFAMKGRCSGIPECCIEFFNQSNSTESRADPEIRAATRAYKESIPEGFGYLPCPGCWEARAFVEVRTCPNEALTFELGVGWSGCACNDVQQLLFLVPPNIRAQTLAILERGLLRAAEAGPDRGGHPA